MSDAIAVESLVKVYRSHVPGRGPRAALNGLDLRVGSGGITGLLGPNGSGKTTAIRILLGLAKATSGRATVLGCDAWRESLAVRRRVAYVPAERTVFEWMRVGKFIEGVAQLSKKWDSDYAARLMRRWDIDSGIRLSELSTGARSKLLLTAALAGRPDILILDEPGTGLDPAATDDALSELVGLAADGTTILLVTHQIDVVNRICDRVTIVSSGREVLTSDLDELRSSWAMIDVTGVERRELMERWEEVESAAHNDEYTRLVVRSDPDEVAKRVRLVGGEVASLRRLTLREVYLAVTPHGDEEESRDADKNHLA